MSAHMPKEYIWTAVFLDASGTIFRPEFDAYGRVSIYPDAQAILQCFRKRMFTGVKVKTGKGKNSLQDKQANAPYREMLQQKLDALGESK